MAGDAPREHPPGRGGARAVRHVVLVGLMGAGKTSIGVGLAHGLGLPFRDSDADLHRDLGLTARSFQERSGERLLHAWEARHLLDAVASDRPSVIAAAASTIEDAACRDALAGPGVVVLWLRGRPGILAGRQSSGPHRPGFEEDVERGLSAQARRREPLYARVADAAIEVDAATVEATTAACLAAVERIAGDERAGR